MPSPLGVVYQPEPSKPLPFSIQDDMIEAKNEREILGQIPDGIGR
jgi:hypothetical protein